MELDLTNKEAKDLKKLSVKEINDMLLDKICDYVTMNKNNDIETKPDEFDQLDTDTVHVKKSQHTIDDELEEIHRDEETKIDRQLYNIADNIVLSYFSLPDQKFMAILERIPFWGLNLTLKEFIMSYYLFNKTNLYLKQFVIMHLDKLLTMCSKIIEKQIISKFKLYDFNTNNTTLKTLKQNLIDKEAELQKIEPSDLIVNRNKNLTDLDTIAQMKLDILNDLKKSHPELEK